MNTQETTFNGMKINGFAMLFIHLVILTAAIVACFFIGKNIFYGIGRIYYFYCCFHLLGGAPCGEQPDFQK